MLAATIQSNPVAERERRERECVLVIREQKKRMEYTYNIFESEEEGTDWTLFKVKVKETKEEKTGMVFFFGGGENIIQ